MSVMFLPTPISSSFSLSLPLLLSSLAIPPRFVLIPVMDIQSLLRTADSYLSNASDPLPLSVTILHPRFSMIEQSLIPPFNH